MRRTEPQSAIADSDMGALSASLLLALVIGGSVFLRLPAMHWLEGAGISADYSFHPDVNRFVLAAEDIRAPNPDGYPQGMTTLLYLTHRALARFVAVGVLPVLQGITLFFAGLLVLLTYLTARFWRLGRTPALLGAAFLGVAPLCVVQSNFGTADVTAACFFYATLLAGGQYLRSHGQIWFVLLCALTGMSIAIKFFVPLFAPVALVLAVQRRNDRLAQTLSAILIGIGSFELLSLFNYSLWDFHKLLHMLRTDNMFIGAAGLGPMQQLRLYAWDLVSAVGIPCAVTLVIALISIWKPLRERWLRQKQALLRDGWPSLVTPASLFIAAFGVHAVLIVGAGVHFQRHLLVFVPALCILAGGTLWRLINAPRPSYAIRLASISAILSFQTYDAIAIESLYTTDIRRGLADWSAQAAAQGKHVIAIDDYLEVRGATYDPRANPLAIDSSSYIATCDMEYVRYLGHTSPNDIVHPTAGQNGVDFFNGVFSGSSDFGFVREFVSTPRGVELGLIDANILAPIGSYVPRRCYVIGRSDLLPQETQRAIRAHVDTSKDSW